MDKINTSKTTANMNSKKYYGVEIAENFASSITNNKIFILANMLLIIMSSIVMISLNITNLENLNNQKESLNILNDDINHKLEQIDMLDQIVKGELKPKLTMVNSAVSVTIPSQLSNLATKLNNQIKNLETMVNKQCTGNILGGLLPTSNPSVGTLPEQGQEPDNDSTDDIEGDMRPLNLNVLNDCSKYPNTPIAQFSVSSDIHPMPSLTSPIQSNNKCIFHPTIALGESIYIYSHQIRKTPCGHEDTIGQKVNLGRIVDKGFSGPRASQLSTWELKTQGYLSSCSVAASGETGWVLCVTTDKYFYNTTQYGPVRGLTLYKLSTDGSQEIYNITYDKIIKDVDMVAMILSTGPGLARGNKLVFLGIITAKNINTDHILCPEWSCTNIENNERTCAQALRLDRDMSSYRMNAIVTVDLTETGQLMASISLLTAKESYVGSEGGIIPERDGYGIMISNRGWFARIRYGITQKSSEDRYKWINYMSFETPYYLSCEGGRICPSRCKTSFYTIPTILSSNGNIIIGVKAKTQSTTSMISINTEMNLVDQAPVFDDYKTIDSTITQCFEYKRKPWCLILLTGIPGDSTGKSVAVHTFQIYKSCVVRQSYVDESGSRYVLENTTMGVPIRKIYQTSIK